MIPGLRVDHPLRAKLMINAPGDQYEQEADRVAEQVTTMREPAFVNADTAAAPPGVEGKCCCGGTCSRYADEEAEPVRLQRLPPEIESHRNQDVQETAGSALQRAGSGSSGQAAPAIVHDVLRSSGERLSAATRAFMEPRFGREFGSVVLHTDPKAAMSAHQIGARAYTVGNHIVFAEGQNYQTSSEGTLLLAHELAHVVQQSGTGATAVQRQAAARPPELDAISIVKIVADENSTEPATAFLSSGRTEPVKINENTFPPGEYELAFEAKQTLHYHAVGDVPGSFIWTRPHAYMWASNVTVVIVPRHIRDFFKGDGVLRESPEEQIERLEAEEILTRNNVTRDDLYLEKQRRKDAESVGQRPHGLNPKSWALNFVAVRQNETVQALKQRQNLEAAAKRLSKIRPQYVDAAVEYMFDVDQANRAAGIYSIRYGGGGIRDVMLESTDFVDRGDLRSTLDEFAAEFDSELRALTEATLNSSEIAVLEATYRYVEGVGPGYLADELKRAKGQPKVAEQLQKIHYEEEHPPEDEGSVVEHAIQLEKHENKINALKSDLTKTLSSESNLKIAGLKGFDACTLLTASEHKAQFMLGEVLYSARRTIRQARNRLHDEKRFVYGADKVIATEKAQLGVTPGSSLDQIIDGVVRKRLSETTIWQDIWSVVDLLINLLPLIPPPAGVILRAVASGINLGRSMQEYADQALAYESSLGSSKPSGTSLGVTFLLTAAGTIIDVKAAQTLAAEREGLSLGARAEASAAKVLVQPPRSALFNTVLEEIIHDLPELKGIVDDELLNRVITNVGPLAAENAVKAATTKLSGRAAAQLASDYLIMADEMSHIGNVSALFEEAANATEVASRRGADYELAWVYHHRTDVAEVAIARISGGVEKKGADVMLRSEGVIELKNYTLTSAIYTQNAQGVARKLANQVRLRLGERFASVEFVFAGERGDMPAALARALDAELDAIATQTGIPRANLGYSFWSQ